MIDLPISRSVFFLDLFFPKKHHSALSLAPSQPCWLVQGSLRTHGNSYRPGAVPAWPVDGPVLENSMVAPVMLQPPI